MTDKQIIIDSVDVSGCTHYRNYNDEFHCDLLSEPLVCADNPNCYYKQLKRKEQECEELKAKCKKYVEVNEQKTKYYAELKAENTKLKEELNKKQTNYYDDLDSLGCHGLSDW